MAYDSGASSPSANSGGKIGPRAKCDQVVYEAIAKAAEIVVRSRCDVPSSSVPGSPHSGRGMGGKFAHPYSRHRHVGLHGNSSASSSRFNLEVEEVDQVRSILQRWRRSLHVPLRLDVYYEFDSQPDSGSDNLGMNGQQVPQRELLERWCIDYVASSSSDSGAGSFSNDDTIAQLRQVCKKVVVLLRSLHCLSRMMPAYRLHRRLAESKSANGAGGGVGPSAVHGHGGYYAHEYPQSPSQPSHRTGRIGFSFYASGDESDVISLSCQSSPFGRQELCSVPTPYGMLHLTALYDASVKVDRLLEHVSNKATPVSRGISIPIPAVGHDQRQHRLEERQRQFQQGREPSFGAKPSSMPGRNAMELAPRHNSYPAKVIQNYADQLSLDTTAGVGNSPKPERPIVRRAHSSVSEAEIEKQNQHEVEEGGQRRVLSGLSLALMNDENSKPEHLQAGDMAMAGTNEAGTSAPPSPPQNIGSVDDAAMRRQRLALHHPPPVTISNNSGHGTGASPTQASSASPPRRYLHGNGNAHHSGEYGYAYNNNLHHWQTNRQGTPNASGPIRIMANDNQTGEDGGAVGAVALGSSPSPLMGTPPTPMFIGSPQFAHRRASFKNEPGVKGRDGISGNSAKVSPAEVDMGPPFQTNPTSLQAAKKDPGLQEQQRPSQGHGRYVSSAHTGGDQNTRASNGTGLLLPPLTSLDLLHMSPFKASADNGSLLSSLSMAGVGVAGTVGGDEGPFAGSLNSANVGSSAYPRNVRGSDMLLRSSGGGTGGGSALFDSPHMTEPSTSFDDMPFAVDPSSLVGVGGALDGGVSNPGNSGGNSGGANQSGLTMASNMGGSTSSSVVTSFAHRCATGSRLKMFDSTVGHDSKMSGNATGPESHEVGNVTGQRMVDGATSGKSAAADVQVSSLADQLAEFRSFGASLTVANGSSRSSFSTAPGGVALGGNGPIVQNTSRSTTPVS